MQRLLGEVLGALLLAVVGVAAVLFVWSGGLAGSRPPPLVWEAQQIQVLLGRGLVSGEQLQIYPDASGRTLITLPAEPFSAEEYPYLLVERTGEEGAPLSSFVWLQADGSRDSLDIGWAGQSVAMLAPSAQEGWQGEIRQLGIITVGHANRFSLLRVTALPRSPATMWRGILQEWRVWEPFTGHTIHFRYGGPEINLELRPSVLIGVTTLLALALFALRRWLGRRPPPWQAAALIFLAGWMVLDLRWEGDLWRQHAVTRATYSGADWEARQRAAPDGDLFAAVETIKKLMPQSPQRLFVIVTDYKGRGEFYRLRTLYHLLPHRVYAEEPVLPDPSALRVGDYVLRLWEPTSVLASNGMLRWRQWQVPATRIYAEENFILYRIDAPPSVAGSVATPTNP